MKTENLTRQRAFNEGCDARLAGKPTSVNPYSIHFLERRFWLRGWRDVDKNWGKSLPASKRKKLPEAEEDEEENL